MDRRESEEMNMEQHSAVNPAENTETAERAQRPMRREQGQGVELIGQAVRAMEAIEHKIQDAYRVPLSKDKCMVSASEMIDLIGQLRMVLPKAVVQAQQVIAQSQ